MSDPGPSSIGRTEPLPQSGGGNLWNTYLSAFWESTVIEGKTIREWLAYFAVLPPKGVSTLSPQQVNELAVLVMQRSVQAYYYCNKLRMASEALEVELDLRIKAKIKERLEWYRDSKDESGRKLRTPGRETLVTLAQGEMESEFSALRRGKIEASFFETIIKSLESVANKLATVNTANAHEVRLTT